MRRILLFSILAVAMTAAAVPARADGLTGAGLQIGWSANRDAFLAGFHYNARPLGEELDLVPSLDFGFGDVFFVAPNVDAHYVLKTKSKMMPYVGAGMTFPWYNFDSGGDWQFGGAIIGGAHVNKNMAFEVKWGLGDAPDWKFVFLLHK
jgi:opacity protein-like surface antigen